MSNDVPVVITCPPPGMRSETKTEICEHKGIGHPDTICDGVVETVSRALCLAYQRAYGEVQHHNVDKALLIAGQSAPRFGGGEMNAPIRLIVCGRATQIPGVDMNEFVSRTARGYLARALRCDPGSFCIEPAIREGSANLRRVFSRKGSVCLANDTSFGVGYAPYSDLERKVLELGRILRSPEFHQAFPAAGDDYKVMGSRVDQRLRFVIALAFIDREIGTPRRYFELKAEIKRYLEMAVGAPDTIGLNMLDDLDAVSEDGIYLTVTGLSAEHGDDGQVGRGNRVNGLITPCRTMSLEAAAGKNPVAHVGKLYNVLAHEIARAICAEVEGIDEASVQILSTIGKPVNEPQLVAIQALSAEPLDREKTQGVETIARGHLDRIEEISNRLIAGELNVF